MIDLTKLTTEEKEFFTGIVSRLENGDVKSVGTELLKEFVKGLTTEVFQRAYRLGDVLCQGEYAEAFNSFLARENKSPLHLICVGLALAQQQKHSGGASERK